MQSWSNITEAQPVACKQMRQARAHGRLHHATLCIGPVLDDLLAWTDALTASLLCSAPGRAPLELQDGCGVCAACRKLAGGNHPDVHRVRPGDKNTIGVDAIRSLSTKLGLSRHEAAYKIVVFHQADTMLQAAQNALLKTLEEPTGDTLFFLLTRRPKTMLPTVRSRCFTVRLAPPGAARQQAALRDAQIDPALWHVLLPLCGGHPALAQNYAEQQVGEAWQTLQALAGGSSPATEIFKVAATYGTSVAGSDMLQALIELHVHAVLATARGITGGDPRLHIAGSPVAAARTASLLQQARAQKHLHVNRVLLLEQLLFALTGATAPDARVA